MKSLAKVWMKGKILIISNKLLKIHLTLQLLCLILGEFLLNSAAIKLCNSEGCSIEISSLNSSLLNINLQVDNLFNVCMKTNVSLCDSCNIFTLSDSTKGIHFHIMANPIISINSIHMNTWSDLRMQNRCRLISW